MAHLAESYLTSFDQTHNQQHHQQTKFLKKAKSMHYKNVSFNTEGQPTPMQSRNNNNNIIQFNEDDLDSSFDNLNLSSFEQKHHDFVSLDPTSKPLRSVASTSRISIPKPRALYGSMKNVLQHQQPEMEPVQMHHPQQPIGMNRAQSMRVPPGFSGTMSRNNSQRNVMNNFNSYSDQPASRHLKRFVTFGNVLKAGNADPLGLGLDDENDMSDDDDLDVVEVHDESLMDLPDLLIAPGMSNVNVSQMGGTAMHRQGSKQSMKSTTSHNSTSTTTSQVNHGHQQQYQPTNGFNNSSNYMPNPQQHMYHNDMRNMAPSPVMPAYMHNSPASPPPMGMGMFGNNSFNSFSSGGHMSPSMMDHMPYSRQNSMSPINGFSQPSHYQHHFQQQQHRGNGGGSEQQRQLELMQQTLQSQMMMNYMLQQNLMNQQRSNSTSPQLNMPMRQHNSPSPGASTSPYPDRQISSLLIKHKTTGYRPNLGEILGHVVEFSRDSHGSRLVQCLMETASAEEKEILINEVMPESVSLMQDLFGNYVMQNFIEHCREDQRTVFARQIKDSMNFLSMQPHGCRVVQRAIDLLPTQQRNSLLEEVLFPVEKINRCAKDPHATHVLQKAVVLLQKEIRANQFAEENSRLLDAIETQVASDVLQLSVHPHACRLVQRTLGDCEYNMKRSSHVMSMVETVRKVFPMLSVDQHGNFILQHLLDNGTKDQSSEVQKFVCSKFLELAQHKFGSHLVEKCLQCADEKQAEALVRELLAPTKPGFHPAKRGEDGDDVLLTLMKDPYANFVVQRAFDASKGEMRQNMVREIRSRSEILSRFTYGRHILSHVNKSEAQH